MICKDPKEALELGHTHFFTGKPCSRGHIAKRYAVSKQCVECQRIRTNKYGETKKAKIKARERHLKKKYGVDLDWLAKFTHCPICSCELTYDRGPAGKCVDHCHASGEVRGVLCNHCNRALGLFKDSCDNLGRAIEYLNDSDKVIPKEWIDEKP